MLNLSKIFKKSPKKVQPSTVKEILKNRYSTFQNLLAKNNHVLELMADMEEKLSGEYLFDRHYINTNARLIAESVLNIIEDLNTISNDKYKQLYNQYYDINNEIQKTLSSRLEIPVSDLIIPLENLTAKMTNIAGGKTAHLGEIKNRLNLPTPDGFAITAYAYKKFMEHNRLGEKINERLSSLSIDNIDNMEELNKVSTEIQDMVIRAEMPEDLENAIQKAVESLKFKVNSSGKEFTHSCHPDPELDSGVSGSQDTNTQEMLKRVQHDAKLATCNSQPATFRVSVRSSAIHEDGEFSFAGQYSTFLNVSEDLILQKYKEVVASLFTPRAIFYYKTKGFLEEEMVMSVGVLKMIDAKAGGVVYTSDPNAPEKNVVIINALWGLGKSVVDGREDPNSYIVSRETGTILEEKVPEQHLMLICTPKGDIKEINISDKIKNKRCLTAEQIKKLFNHALALENHYGRPQDIEWAIDQDNQIHILQTRQLRMFTAHSSQFTVPRRVERYNILLDKGVIACKGIGYGKAFILKDEENLKDFPEGSVLVARHTSTKFVTVMNKASAIITDVGSITGHMASLSREYNIPTILDTEVATTIIKDGAEITVDAINCNIYEGKVDELLEYASKKKEPFKDTHLFKTLERVLKLIVPLNLIDPDKENFKPEYCKTFHDITRFAHEIAMAEIFKTGRGQDIETFEDLMSAVTFAESGEHIAETVNLRAGIPVDAYLIDIDGGIRRSLKKVTPEDILSIPFSALLKGLRGMKWPGPRPADVRGFIGMIAHTASIPEEQLYKMGEKSYAIISRNYMNFNIRLGYHFSMVEAYAGENINDNYIKFFFKGGGSTTDRRLRRVRLIKEILKKMDFKVNVIEDVIDAMLTKYKQSTIEEKLEVLGKLTAYTKQLDMVMYNDAVTDMFIEDFVRDHFASAN